MVDLEDGVDGRPVVLDTVASAQSAGDDVGVVEGGDGLGGVAVGQPTQQAGDGDAVLDALFLGVGDAKEVERRATGGCFEVAFEGGEL